jgi:hypothetical protein
MKLSEVARYWAARELTGIERAGNRITFRAPFACPQFTVRLKVASNATPRWRLSAPAEALTEVPDARALKTGTWVREKEGLLVCVDLPKGTSAIELA